MTLPVMLIRQCHHHALACKMTNALFGYTEVNFQSVDMIPADIIGTASIAIVFQLHTMILEVNLFAFAYKLFHEDFQSVGETSS